MARTPDADELRQLRLDGAVVRAAERIIEAAAHQLCPCGGDRKGGDGCSCDPPFGRNP